MKLNSKLRVSAASLIVLIPFFCPTPAMVAVWGQETLLAGVEGDGSGAVDYINDLLDSGQQDKALKELDAALKKKPNVVLFQLRGQVLAKEGEIDKAKADYDAALKLEAENATTFRLRGKLLIKRDPQQSLSDLEKSLKLSPDDPLTHLTFGVYWAIEKQPEKSVSYLEKSIELDPTNPDPYFNLVEVLRRTGDLEKAIRVSDQSLQIDRQVKNTFANRAGVLKAVDRIEEAIDAYTKAIDLDPSDHQLCNLRGNLYLKVDQPGNALDDFKVCAKAEPDKGMSWGNLARAHDRLGNSTAALEMANRAVEVEPEYDYGWFIRGEIHRDAENFDEALRDFQMSAKLDPDWDGPWVELGDCYAETEEFQKSIDAYSKALELDPDYVYCYVNRAWAYLQTDQLEEALQDCKTALATEPNDRVANINAGDACRFLKRYEQATQYFSTVIGSGSENANDSLWRKRADCFRKLGMDEAADRDIAMANKISPPIGADDKAVLKAIASSDAEAFLNLTAPDLKRLLDASKIQERLKRISNAFPQIGSAKARSIDDHPELGSLQRTLTLALGEWSDESSFEVTIGRDQNGDLLGVEVRDSEKPVTAIGTMDALAGLDKIATQSETFMRFAMNGKIEPAIKAMPEKSMIDKDAARGFFKNVSGMIGVLKRYELQDIILDMPALRKGERMISVYALAETDKGLYATLSCSYEVRGDDLVLADISIGNSVVTKYLTQNRTKLKTFIDAFASGDVDRLISLSHPKDQSMMQEQEFQAIFQKEVCKQAGELIGIDKETVTTEVNASEGDFLMTSNFVARFENKSIQMFTRFSFGRPTNYTLQTGDAGIDWVNSDAVKERLIARAEKDLRAFVGSNANDALKMLNGYTGFEAVTEATVSQLQEKYSKALGDIQSYKLTEAFYSDAEEKWTLLFDVVGTKGKRTGRASYVINGLDANLTNIALVLGE